jgi:MFS family permease
MNNSLKNSLKSPEKKEESLIDKFNDSNSRSFLKSGPGEPFNISLFPKHNNRKTKFGNDLTAEYTAKFLTKKESIRRIRTLTIDDKKNFSNESDTESSLRMLEQKLSKRSRGWDESMFSRNIIAEIDRTIVDSIENIYSQIKKIPIRLKLQNILIFLIAILVGIFNWSLLFQLSDNKLERNYCFTNLYQFDSCSIEQICKYNKDKINYMIYNNTIDLYSKTKNEKDNTFIEENNIINNYYKQFSLKYSNILASNNLLNSHQLFSSGKDKVNFAIILAHKQQWNLFLRYFFACQKKNYSFLILIMYLLGGAIGSTVFGLQADIRGRKIMIHITLLITLLGLGIFSLHCFLLDNYYNKSKTLFRQKYTFINENDIDYKNILENIYSQTSVKIKLNRTFIIYLIGVFLTNFGSFPLNKISLALLLENSTSEREVLNNYRIYNIVFKGCSALLTSLLIVNLNSITLSYILLFLYNFFLLIASFFVLNESMRYLYEYCEWKELSDFIRKSFVLEEHKDIQFLNDSELKIFQRQENEIINKEYEIRRLNLKAEDENDDIFEKNNFYNYLKRKKSFLIRNIRRQKDVIIKFIEINYNPFIILICLNANRNYVKFKYLLFSILLLLHFFFYILKQEMLKKPFFREKDLYFSKGHNYIINSNFFMLLITSYASNYFYYFLFRFSYFKISIIFSSIILSICSFLYYIHSLRIKKTPLYFNEYNFGMLGQYYRDFHRVNELYVQGMFFTLNGICLYIHLLIIKISKTFYRCTFLMFHSYTILASAIIAEIFNVEIKNPFLLLGFINLLCLLLILFLKEMNDLPNLISDFKQSVDKKLEKHEKSEKLK